MNLDPATLADLLAALVRSVRVFAFVTGALVVVDSLGILMRVSEQPPHRPHANAWAWLLAAATVCAAAGYFLAARLAWVGPEAPAVAKLAQSGLWLGLGGAFTARAITRAERPRLTILSAALMVVFGTLIAFMVPAP